MRHYARMKVEDKKKLLREEDHMTRPPRLEGVVKNTKTNPVRKPKAAKKRMTSGS